MPLRKDDPNINDKDILLRRIPDTPQCVYEDEEDGMIKPSSANFLDRENALSVNLQSLTTIETVLKGHDDFGLVCFQAAIPRKENHIVDSDPIADEENPENNDPSHCVICPQIGLGEKAKKRAARNIARAVQWLVHTKSNR